MALESIRDRKCSSSAYRGKILTTHIDEALEALKQ